MKGTIWLSYDLGVSGDYEGIYAWLENHDAKECGSSVAFLKSYEFEGDLLESLKADIEEAVRALAKIELSTHRGCNS